MALEKQPFAPESNESERHFSVSDAYVYLQYRPDPVIQIQDENGRMLVNIPDWYAEENPDAAARDIEEALTRAKGKVGIFLPEDPSSFSMRLQIECTNGLVIKDGQQLNEFGKTHVIKF